MGVDWTGRFANRAGNCKDGETTAGSGRRSWVDNVDDEVRE